MYGVQIKNHTLSGSMPAVKKSIDWFCDTANIIDPKEFGSLGNKKEAEGGQFKRISMVTHSKTIMVIPTNGTVSLMAN